MVKIARVEATITAQNKLRPGLSAAARDLGLFRRMQTRAFSAFSSSAARASSAAVQKSAAAMAAAQSRLALANRGAMAAVAAPLAASASYKRFADVDRQITRIGITANASQDELAGVRKQIEAIADETAQSSGKVTGGLDVLVAQGRSLKEGLEFLPSVARTAAASNSEMEDIAKTADSVSSNFKIAGKEMQTAFDIMAEGGKAGMFELKDMSRYLPSLGPAAAALGMQGTKGLTDLVAILQIMRKGSGTSEEAYSSMNNVLMKMDSDETRKNFKKFGIDSAAALERTRKAGGNVFETFEKLIKLATKGDNAKIGEIVKDAEFKRGVLALRSYEGEWQRLAKTISATASGSVGRDLLRVTNDARAQIDRMFAAIENRAVQFGAVLAKVVIPLDETLRRIERGENRTANIAAEGLQHASADLIANQELDGATPGDYDPETRRMVDARKEFLQRQRIESERERLGGKITGLEAERAKVVSGAAAEKRGKILLPWVEKTLDAKAKRETDKIDFKLAAARDSLAGLDALVAALDELSLRAAELQGAGAPAKRVRMAQPAGEPEFAYVGPGSSSFAPTLGGGGASPGYTGIPVIAPLPPSRPGTKPAPVSSSADVSSALGGGAASLAEVKSSVESLGPAGQSAGSTMAAGLRSGISQMEADLNAAVARMQQRLDSLKAPSLGFGGLNTGKGMSEVR